MSLTFNVRLLAYYTDFEIRGGLLEGRTLEQHFIRLTWFFDFYLLHVFGGLPESIYSQVTFDRFLNTGIIILIPF